jgi:outer membrane protein TolC
MTRYQTEILPRVLQYEQMAQEAYSAGQTNLPALVQALQSARDTRQRGLQASLDYQRALADLERAIGASVK